MKTAKKILSTISITYHKAQSPYTANNIMKLVSFFFILWVAIEKPWPNLNKEMSYRKMGFILLLFLLKDLLLISQAQKVAQSYFNYYWRTEPLEIVQAKQYLEPYLISDHILPKDAAFQLNSFFRAELVRIYRKYIEREYQESMGEFTFMKSLFLPGYQKAFDILYDSPLFLAWDAMMTEFGLVSPRTKINLNEPLAVQLDLESRNERLLRQEVVQWFYILDHFHIIFSQKSFENLQTLHAIIGATLILGSVAALLNQANFNRLENHANHATIAALHFMSKASVLNQTNLDILFTPQQAILMTETIKKALYDRLPDHLCSPALWARLLAYCQNANNPEQAILEETHRLLVGANSRVFNDRQSTHAPSVEASIPKASKLLLQRYGYQLSDFDDWNTQFYNWMFTSSENNLRGTASILARMKQWVNALPESTKNTIAQEAFDDLTTDNDLYYVEPQSDVSTIQLLALAWLAIHDDKYRQCTLEEAKLQLREGLYEAKRAYNLSAQGVDQGGRSLNTCPPGAYDKIVEQLWVVYKGVEIKYMTPTTASIKLQAMIHEAAFEHVLLMLEAATNAEDYLNVTHAIDQMRTEGIEAVLPDIVNQRKSSQSLSIADKFFDEFEEMFANNHQDPLFKAMLEAGNSAQLTNLEYLQKPTLASKGYQAYCKKLLVTEGFFSKKLLRSNAVYLSEHRHDSQEEQHNYDKQYGLVVRR